MAQYWVCFELGWLSTFLCFHCVSAICILLILRVSLTSLLSLCRYLTWIHAASSASQSSQNRTTMLKCLGRFECLLCHGAHAHICRVHCFFPLHALHSDLFTDNKKKEVLKQDLTLQTGGYQHPVLPVFTNALGYHIDLHPRLSKQRVSFLWFWAWIVCVVFLLQMKEVVLHVKLRSFGLQS